TAADTFGLEASREPDAAATTFLKLGEYRDLEPHPIIELLFYNHPSGRSRIRHAMEWKARTARLTGPVARRGDEAQTRDRNEPGCPCHPSSARAVESAALAPS